MIETTLTGESKDILDENIAILKELFPEIFSEDKIDFDKLKTIFGGQIDNSKERYSFTWPGKSQAIKESQKQSNGALRPCKEESKNWDSTKNLYIEGNNLEVLKLLQKSYFNKIKAIYIDPPYNTGNDIIYKNDYSDSIDYYLKITGQKIIDDDEEISVITNTDSTGRLHTNWLNDIYPCLKLARNLLDDDGIIFVAIDDYEVANLKKILDELFGEFNYVGTLITKCNPQGRGKKNLDPVHEYHLIYAKNKHYMNELKISRNNNGVQEYQTFMRSGTNSRKFERPNRFYPMLVKDEEVFVITQQEYDKIYDGSNFDENHLIYLKDKYEKLGYQVIFPIARNGEEKVWQRTYERATKECSTYICVNGTIKTPKSDLRTPRSLWDSAEYSNVEYGTNKLIEMFNGKKTFEYPKSVYTVKDLISTAPEGIVLDFYAGSSTTAHAVMELNAEKNLNYSFILIQIPAIIDSDKEAYKLGYENLCQIGIDRIIKSSNQIKEKFSNNIDTGFKLFKLDSSNLKKWEPNYKNLGISLDDYVDNIKSDRTQEDLVYEILLKYGLDLSVPIEKYELFNNNFYSIGFGALVICLDDNITKDIANSIIELTKDSDVKRVVFKDSGFVSDSDKANLKETLKTHKIDEFITI